MWLLYQFFQFSILHTGNDVQCSCCAVETGEPKHSGEGICWVPSEFVWGCCHICTKEAKKAKYQNHTYFITITIWVYVNKAVPAPSLMQGLSSGADRPLSGSRRGQSPGCLVQTKASHIALLCLLTTWLCHQVLLTITYHANSTYHALLHGTHAEWSRHILPYPHSQTLYLRLMQSLICIVICFWIEYFQDYSQ